FFFFQAEDGIRDDLVTGVQTCALPIYRVDARRSDEGDASPSVVVSMFLRLAKGLASPSSLRRASTRSRMRSRRRSRALPDASSRSEERRAGKAGPERGRIEVLKP